MRSGMRHPNDCGVIAFVGLSFWELVLILIIALVIFGPKKLPEMGKALGASLREFKKAAAGGGEPGETKEDDKALDKPEAEKAAK
jgi:sec-independent protein translocase protein TatA